MRVATLLAVGLLLTTGSVSAAFAVESDTAQTDKADRASTADPAPDDRSGGATSDAPQTAMRPETTPETTPETPQVAPSSTPPAESADAPAAATAPASAEPAQEPAKTETAAPADAAAAPAESTAAARTIVPSDDLLYLPVSRYLQDNAKKTLAGTDQADRQVLIQFYDSRMGSTLWVGKTGYNDAAKNVIATLKDADSWGLRAADFKIADLKPGANGEFNLDDLTAAETRLSLAAMEYARDARGDRITDPSSQLGTYLDRKPVVLDRRTVIDSLASVPDKGTYLTELHPKHPQFIRLREKLLALRTNAKEAEALKIADGPKLMPGASHAQIAILHKRLKVAAATVKDDGSPADDTYYDKALATAVVAYKESKGIQPANPSITAALRRSLNASNDVSDAKLVANMEEWRWMPDDLGKYYIMVNIPEFKVRVISDGQVIHEERIVSGRPDTQSPIFSEMMRTVVIQPRWNVPDSIKIKELLPSLRAGGDPLRRQGLVMERNGRKMDPYSVDWNRNDIRNFNVYQPPSGSNALGVVKFLFPNKHAVYLHDTPSKSLFNESTRAFSHGCIRVRNPVKLAEILLDKDKGWDASMVQNLIAKGPEENEISLDQPVPVHVTYFTAWVDDSGEVQTFGDVYGHEKRINLALAGRWNQIAKADEKKVSPEDIPQGDGWGGDGFGSLFGSYDERDNRGRKKYDPGLGGFFKQVLGGF
ncbi:L,D-transpeptidase family protein [Hyphomicrobium sp.]|uniref:L,D-transpeptidase family protein n=1 Tax=Hyphomicrobium sp. TaxID=82 RepID=UPI001D72DA63|nr:L,D-transpeptidase family protein [Hyphomicrobium sp.]MBY0558879.1 L,D-transpeptidase family protein [Hyphomicrobium sp.]